MLCEFGRPRHDLVLRDDRVDGPDGERLGRCERLAFEDGHQRLVGADQTGQSLAAATAGHDSEEHFRLTDEEVAVSHHTKIVGPGELRAETEHFLAWHVAFAQWSLSNTPILLVSHAASVP